MSRSPPSTKAGLLLRSNYEPIRWSHESRAASCGHRDITTYGTNGQGADPPRKSEESGYWELITNITCVLLSSVMGAEISDCDKIQILMGNGKMEKINSPNLDGSNIGTNLSVKVTKNPLNLQLQKSNIFILLLSHIFVMLCLLWQHNKYLRFIFNVFVENC